jgi:hypothetical protein
LLVTARASELTPRHARRVADAERVEERAFGLTLACRVVCQHDVSRGGHAHREPVVVLLPGRKAVREDDAGQ